MCSGLMSPAREAKVRHAAPAATSFIQLPDIIFSFSLAMLKTLFIIWFFPFSYFTFSLRGDF